MDDNFSNSQTTRKVVIATKAGVVAAQHRRAAEVRRHRLGLRQGIEKGAGSLRRLSHSAQPRLPFMRVSAFEGEVVSACAAKLRVS